MWLLKDIQIRLTHLPKQKSILIISVTILIFFAVIGSIWYAPESSLGVYARDHQLAVEVQQQQRSDGFFVSTPHDTNPPVISETYFALMTLRGLHADIPNIPRLKISLPRLEQEAETSLQQGHPAIGPREVYEDLMIRDVIGLPVDQHVLNGYQQQLAANLASASFSYTLASIHDWYYTILTFVKTGTFNDIQRSSVLHVVQETLYQKPAPSLIATALVIDAAALLHIPLDKSINFAATAVLLHARDLHGGFITAQSPDILSTYFAVLLASDIGRNDVVDKVQLRHYLATLREWDGYHISQALPINPLATVYAIVLRGVLDSGDVSHTPR